MNRYDIISLKKRKGKKECDLYRREGRNLAMDKILIRPAFTILAQLSSLAFCQLVQGGASATISTISSCSRSPTMLEISWWKFLPRNLSLFFPATSHSAASDLVTAKLKDLPPPPQTAFSEVNLIL